MTLAMPIWEGRISPVFDVARHLLLVELENGSERSRQERLVTEHSLHNWVTMLAELGVDSLVCGAITDELAAALMRGGVQIVPWIKGEVQPVLAAYLAGELSDPSFAVPGSRCGRGASDGPGARGAGRGTCRRARRRGQTEPTA